MKTRPLNRNHRTQRASEAASMGAYYSDGPGAELLDAADGIEQAKQATKTRKQCKACPWKVSTDPNQIPNGYCADKHAALSNTITEPGALNLGGTLRLMACHESPVGSEQPCVGWLANQLGPGNNLGLRFAVARGRISADFELDGEQHETLQDTLPRGRR